MSGPVATVTVRRLQQLLALPEPPLLLDVREEDEWQHCRIEGALHVPMSQLVQRLGELEPARPTVVYCHHGVRSQRVAEFLLRHGFADVSNLAGGIDAVLPVHQDETRRGDVERQTDQRQQQQQGREHRELDRLPHVDDREQQHDRQADVH